MVLHADHEPLLVTGAGNLAPGHYIVPKQLCAGRGVEGHDRRPEVGQPDLGALRKALIHDHAVELLCVLCVDQAQLWALSVGGLSLKEPGTTTTVLPSLETAGQELQG
eukprot:CAMPEP_0195099882 /NCGR_PEP_ID=MMETSP0448-20130528/60054_1 /TAXON_ID=66468 /ORGANISM="Heterocapsa triquestra, Strain CCMP 448" /LENGTH=107 /DNA_ID=CAMNT_0040134891 /DNA_START=246 /DNA_END=570 /DNA_ORIENTATION=+